MHIMYIGRRSVYITYIQKLYTHTLMLYTQSGVTLFYCAQVLSIIQVLYTVCKGVCRNLTLTHFGGHTLCPCPGRILHSPSAIPVSGEAAHAPGHHNPGTGVLCSPTIIGGEEAVPCLPPLCMLLIVCIPYLKYISGLNDVATSLTFNLFAFVNPD